MLMDYFTDINSQKSAHAKCLSDSLIEASAKGKQNKQFANVLPAKPSYTNLSFSPV